MSGKGMAWVGLCVLMNAAAVLRADLPLARDGRTEYVAVLPAAASDAEIYAAEELVEFVRRASGATLPVVEESAHPGGPAIYLGSTNFAAGQGVDLAVFGAEEWLLRVADGNLILAGGRPRGTLYAVYEFLEGILGVRFLDPLTEHVPAAASLAVPAGLDRRGAPALDRREIYMVVNGVGVSGSDHWLRFQVRRRVNSFANAWRDIDARYGYAFKYGSPYTTHTHHRYVADFPEAFDKPEYFAVTARGLRHRSQPCMSHPEVRRIFQDKLRVYIERDRAALRERGRGTDSFPRYYSLVPDDGTDGKCFCPECLARAAEYGSYAGVVLEFTNEIAEDIARTHPEIVLATSAYLYYRDIPTGIRPRGNVLVKIAQLPANYNTYPLRDHMRALEHPLNADARAEWERWGAISPMLAVHDYWNHHNARTLAADLKFYRRHGLKHFFTENILMGTHLHHFVDLQFYVQTRLFVDPGQDAEALIEEFLGLYYGPAAPVMLRLMDYIARRHEEEPQHIPRVPASARAFYDPAYFLETDALLDEAERLVSGDARRLANVRQERLPLDRVLLTQWHRLQGLADGDWPFEHERVHARLAANFERAYEKYGGWGALPRTRDEQELAFLKNMPSVPERFAGREIVDVCGPRLRLGRGARIPREPEPDPDAATGLAWRLAGQAAHHGQSPRPVDHSRPPEFGLSDAVSDPKFLLKRVLKPDEIPRDEQYHWYLIGRMQMTTDMYFYGHHTWIFDLPLRPLAYNAALPDQKRYDAHVSLKLEGPAYVPGSNKENAFSIDRIILVEVPPE